MRLRRLSSLVAGTLLAPLFVIVPLDLSAAKPTPQPVSGTESTAKMVDSSHEEVADAALAPATEIAKATRDNARERLGAQTLPNQGVSVLKATTPQDVKEVAHDVLRHRVLVTYEAEAEDITSDTLIARFLRELPVP